jgi:REP element-mobilizing transposase RayT
MPRLARLDTPGLIHHVIIRGIERRKIFRDNKDREDMIDRLSDLLPATNTACFAWAFLPNHAHFLFRSGDAGLPTLMRRLLTGYVVTHELKSLGYDLEKLEQRILEIYPIEREDLYSKSRERIRAEARGVFCYWAVRELGVAGAQLARRFTMTQAGVGYAVRRGEKIVKEKAILMIE